MEVLQLQPLVPRWPPLATFGPHPLEHEVEDPVQGVVLSCKPAGQVTAPPLPLLELPPLPDPELLFEPTPPLEEPDPLLPESEPAPELVAPRLEDESGAVAPVEPELPLEPKGLPWAGPPLAMGVAPPSDPSFAAPRSLASCKKPAELTGPAQPAGRAPAENSNAPPTAAQSNGFILSLLARQDAPTGARGSHPTPIGLDVKWPYH